MGLSDVMTDAATWVAVAGGVAATAGAVWKWMQRPDRRMRLLMPYYERRYAQQAEQWDRYDKRFLEDASGLERKLSLSALYVRLSFKPQAGESSEQPDGFYELARHTTTNICVTGEPGSGKSTFLKAYAVKATRQGWRDWGLPEHRVVFLVSLREFAATRIEAGQSSPDVDGRNRLALHLVAQLRRAGFKDDEDAAAFLRVALRRGRVDVLLDGLDEVPGEKLAVLRRVVREFSTDGHLEMPTKLSRLIVTCRTDNYRLMGTPWTDDLDMRVYELDELRDEEMRTYVHRLRKAFDDPEHGPDRYLDAVWKSGTLAVHRVPLVLAMSVGVFSGKSQVQIPDAVNDLYDKMIGHLLERHAFRDEQDVSPLEFRNSRDKRLLLQRFAALNALSASEESPYGMSFNVFPRSALVTLTKEMSAEFDEKRTVEGNEGRFVDEIINHAGLISPSGDTFQFSHRSIQEYLVASNLRDAGDEGRHLMLAQCALPTWNFTVQLYAAMISSQPAINDFLTRLSAIDPALAGSCLAWSRPDDATAAALLATLATQLKTHLSLPADDDASSGQRLQDQQHTIRLIEGILAAVRSPRESISAMAMAHAEQAVKEVISRDDALELLGSDTNALVKVVDSLSGVGMDQFARLVPTVAETLPDDVRLVGPLWRCLRLAEAKYGGGAIPPDDLAGLRRIASRLLTIVRSPSGLSLLQAQPHSEQPPFHDLRRQVYPFQHGAALDSNLVTLLCWARLLDAAPSPMNRFFQALKDTERPGLFARAESDHAENRRGALFWLARILSGGAMLTAVGYIVHLAVNTPEVFGRLGRPSNLAWILAEVAVISTVFIATVRWSRRWPSRLTAAMLLRPGAAPRQRVSGNAVAEFCAKILPSPLAQFAFLLSPAVYAVALSALLATSTPVFLAAAGLAQLVLVWLPFLAVFDRGDLGRSRNPYIDMYYDDLSIAWLVPDPQRAPSNQNAS